MSAFSLSLTLILFSFSQPIAADSSYQCFKDEVGLLPANIKYLKSINGVNGKAYPPCTEDGQTNCAAVGRFSSSKKSIIAQKVKEGSTVGGVQGQFKVEVNDLVDCSSDGQTECLTNFNFKAASTANLASKVLSGQTVAGVVGTVSAESAADCSSDGEDSCVTTTSFPAVDTTALAAKVIAGNTVAGVSGSAIAEAHVECTGASQDSCLATTTYKTMDLSNKDAGSAQDLNNSNFSTQIKTAVTLEFWDQNGVRHTSLGDADLSEENILKDATIFGVTGTAGGPPNCSSIPGEWILVPGNPAYGTNDFCVMKYEAKQNGVVAKSEAAGQPWVEVSQLDAITACAAIGKGYRLITNDEWMTITTNIAAQHANWSGGIVGTNEMARGHSDGAPSSACAADADDNNAYVETNCTGTSSGTFDQRRTHTLSNGNVIWDIAGNVWEWTDYFNDEDKPSDDGIPDEAWIEYSALGDHSALMSRTDLIPQLAIDSNWGSTQKIGKYWAMENGSGGALRRGGGFGNTSEAGVFAAEMNYPSDFKWGDLGFRCVVEVP